MKRFYSQFRIMLITFALGLASVFVFNGSLQLSDEVTVQLPKTESKSENVLIVFPLCRSEMPRGGGSGPDWTPPPGWIPLVEKENEGCKEINQKNLRLRFN